MEVGEEGYQTDELMFKCPQMSVDILGTSCDQCP